MTWLLYRWTWLLHSPLYVGTTPAGSLNRCRLYVPAHTLWAALTAELARSQHQTTDGELPNYQAVGKVLKQNFRFTYLYPAEKVNGSWQAWLPSFQSGKGLVWCREDDRERKGGRPNREFRLRLLHTRPSTAIDPFTDTAEEGSLRETECVQPRWRDETGRAAGPVAFVGYVFVKESENTIKNLFGVKRLFVGGDTRYGLGRLELVAEPQQDFRIFGSQALLKGGDPRVAREVVLAHGWAPESMMTGERKVLLGWEVGRLAPPSGGETSLWVPGSQWNRESAQATFTIGETGIWRLKENQVGASEEMGLS